MSLKTSTYFVRLLADVNLIVPPHYYTLVFDIFSLCYPIILISTSDIVRSMIFCAFKGKRYWPMI